MNSDLFCKESLAAFERATLYSPTNIKLFADYLKVRFYKSDLGETKSLRQSNEDNTFTIHISNQLSNKHQRFIAAKELMRVWLDCQRVHPVNFRDETAEEMALSFLMPDRHLIMYCQLNNCRPEYHQKIADHFGVTVAALRYKLKQLNLFFDEESRELAQA